MQTWLLLISQIIDQPGISSVALGRRLNISQAAAWQALQLLRVARGAPSFKTAEDFEFDVWDRPYHPIRLCLDAISHVGRPCLEGRWNPSKVESCLERYNS